MEVKEEVWSTLTDAERSGKIRTGKCPHAEKMKVRAGGREPGA